MATLMIVEDESFERNALKNSIDWELIGVKVIGEAANGAQGLNLAMELKPDIILTDVSMPVMNAIEMTERIRKILPETKILFISSYDDFEYARQGIELNIFSYMTKPVNEMLLLRNVKKAVDQITEKELEKRLYNKIKNNYEVSLKLARQALVSRVLMNVVVDSEEAKQLNLGWMLSRDGESLGEIVTAFDEEKTDCITRGLDSLTKTCRSQCSKVVNICLTRGNLVTVFCISPEGMTDAAGKLEKLVDEFFGEKNCKILRRESVCDEEGNTKDAGQLYDEIRQRSLIYASAQVEVGAERKKGKAQIVSEIENIIQTQYTSPITIESIAKAMHFTPNYIGTVFKTAKGCGINRYLMGVRLENAQRLLKESDLPASDIALQCGFDNISYFHSSFKKEKGITPTEYRQKYKG